MKANRAFSAIVVMVLLLLLVAGGSLAQESRPQVGESPAGGGSFLTGGDMHGAVGSATAYQDQLADGGDLDPLGTASAGHCRIVECI